MRSILAGLPEQLVGVSSQALASLAASAAGVVSAAEAARAAVVREAHARGVISASDHPRTRDWVEASCAQAGVSVTKALARQLHDIATGIDGHDLAALRAAVTAGEVPMESAALVAKVFRRLKKKTDYNNWDELLNALILWATIDGDQRNLATIEDRCLSQYGTEEALEEEHATLYELRLLSHFRRDRAGTLSATVTFDPASEAAFTAAIHALAKPQTSPDGELDPRSAGQRRADALLTLAKLSTTPDKDIRGSGSVARVTVTIPLTALLAGLDLGDRRMGDGFGASGDAQHCCDDRCAHPLTGACTHEAAETDERARATEGGEDQSATSSTARHGVTGYGQILSPAEARMFACDAQIIPAVLGVKGEILDMGRSKRLITPGLRDYLHVRDKGCTYPGCSAPPSWCDGHHIFHWARGGPTDRDNLALLCRHHHTVVHRHDHTATVDDDGVHWTRRDGSAIGNRPRATWREAA